MAHQLNLNLPSHSFFLFLSSLVTLFYGVFCSSSFSSSYSSLTHYSSSSSYSSPLTSLSSSSGLTLKTTINPNCDEYQSCYLMANKPDLVYTQSTDNNTSIHFIASTLGGFPGLLITQTNSNDALKVNWDMLLGNCIGSLDFSSLPQNSIGILLLSFFDLNHKDLHWKIGNDQLPNHCDSSRCKFAYSTDPNQSSINQTISIGLEMANVQSSFDDFPHLLFTPSSMHLDLQIKNLNKSQVDSKTGGVKLLIVTSGNAFVENYDENIDDEHSPGIFTKRTFVFSKENITDSNSYIQWKPVAYESPERIMSKTSEIDSSTLTETDLPRLNLPLYCFYQQLATNHSVYMLNVSFVRDVDDDSDNIDLIAWSLVFGLNAPPEEKLSLFIKLMLFVGVGLSLFVMLISLVYVAIKRWQKSRTGEDSGPLIENVLDY